MKKVYTSPEYRHWHKIRGERIERRRREYDRAPRPLHERFSVIDKGTFPAPSDFRLLENTEAVVTFLWLLRSEYAISHKKTFQYIRMSLKDITKIDYAAITILIAIGDDLKYKRILLRGDMPLDIECKKIMVESGYLNNLYDKGRKRFAGTPKADTLFFEKGSGRLSTQDNINISEMIKKVVEYLTGTPEHCQPLRTIILEICGNSIEWSGTESRQWLMVVKYIDEKVVFTVCDVGKGILDTLYRKHDKLFVDMLLSKKDDQILKGAFDQQYESRTGERNRNTGLPSIKSSFSDGKIQNLKVLTNNVLLHFDDDKKSKVLSKGSARFKGTLYQWEITKDCLNKLITETTN